MWLNYELSNFQLFTFSSPRVKPRPAVPSETEDECPMTEWEEWLPCENDCVDGVVENGTQIRFRYHMVNDAISKDRVCISVDRLYVNFHFLIFVVYVKFSYVSFLKVVIRLSFNKSYK